MPTRFLAASGHRTRGQRVPTLRLLRLGRQCRICADAGQFFPPAFVIAPMPLKRGVGINGKKAACTSETRDAGCFLGDVG